MKSESKSDQAAIRLFDGRFCQSPWNTTTSFKRTSSAWQGVPIWEWWRVCRYWWQVSSFCAAEWASLKSVTNLSEVLPLHEEQDFVIIQEQDADGQVTVSTPPVRNQSDLGTTCWNARKQSIAASAGNWVNKGGVTVNVHGLGFRDRTWLSVTTALRSNSEVWLFLKLICNNKLVLSNRLATRSASFSQLEPGS